MILVIGEKPSVCKVCKDALEKNATYKEGYYEGKEYVFTHAVGHLLQTLYPSQVDEQYKKWDLSLLPFWFPTLQLASSGGSGLKKQLKVVKDLFNRKDITEIVNCCDADREGELIFREILNYANPKGKKITRMWLESVSTPEIIQDAFNKRLDQNEYENLYQSALARQHADYHIGLNSTMAYTCVLRKTYTLGRVQTPTLKIICDREREILNFKKKKSYKMKANINKDNGVNDFIYFNEKTKEDIVCEDKKDIQYAIDSCDLGKANLVKEEYSDRKENAPKLYALSDLQIDMSSKYGYKAQEVLDICQRLYEVHKLTTYPRTDENHISEETYKKTYNIISCLPDVLFGNQVNTIKTNNYNINKTCVAKKEIGSHEALMPTIRYKVKQSDLDKLTEKELNVYKAIVLRFLANFYPPAKYRKQEIVFERKSYYFKGSIENVVDKGYLTCLGIEYTNIPFIKDLNDGNLAITKLSIVEVESKPKPRFSEGALIQMMKNPISFMKDNNMKNVIKECGGIGTEATRGAIIEKLKDMKYIEIKGKTLRPTELGFYVIDNCPSEALMSIELTAFLENNLEDIKKGKITTNTFYDNLKKVNDNIVEQFKGILNKVNKFNKSGICVCPNCKGQIIETQYGYWCSNKCGVNINYDALKHLGIPKVEKTLAIQLLTKGKSSKDYVFMSKGGNEYNAKITYTFDKDAQYKNSFNRELVDKKKSKK